MSTLNETVCEECGEPTVPDEELCEDCLYEAKEKARAEYWREPEINPER